MKNKNILYFISAIFLIGCKNSVAPEIRKLDFYDYVIPKNSEYENSVTREVGFLVKNPESDIDEMEFLLKMYAKKLLTKDFISETNASFEEKGIHDSKGYIEIAFFRVSKELPWVMNADYIRPYHLGEGNPVDWIGRFIYDIELEEFNYYVIMKRSKGIFDYGKITSQNKYRIKLVR
ncbi:MAG: hypothetical protein HDR36_00685 [Treponema sp.]|nr:hypothetical protein [Treponema sp.]MBD5440718.1 hypothetical protein [Treponema sp.]